MKKLLTCLALSTVLFSGCTLMHSSEGIIKVNDTVITQAEFDKAFKWIEKYDKKFDKHVSNPQSLLDRNKDNKSMPSQRYIIDKKFVCKIEILVI